MIVSELLELRESCLRMMNSRELTYNCKIGMYDSIISGRILSSIGRGGGEIEYGDDSNIKSKINQNNTNNDRSLLANCVLLFCIISSCLPIVISSSSSSSSIANDIYETKQQFATNYHHHNNHYQHNHPAADHDRSSLETVADQSPILATDQDGPAQQVMNKPQDCMRISNSDSVICVPHKNIDHNHNHNHNYHHNQQHNQQQQQQQLQQQERNHQTAIENFIESLADVRQQRTDKFEPQQAAAAAAISRDWILETNSQQQQQQKERERDYDNDYYSGGRGAQMDGENLSAYQKAPGLNEAEQLLDPCSNFERFPSLVLLNNCRRSIATTQLAQVPGGGKLVTLFNAAGNLSPLAQSSSGSSNSEQQQQLTNTRHELSTRAWRAPQQQQQQHSFRMTTDEARHLFDSSSVVQDGLPVVPATSAAIGNDGDSSSSSSATSTLTQIRTPIMLVKLSDIRNQRRSADGGAQGVNFRNLPGAKRIRRPVSSSAAGSGVVVVGPTRSHRSGNTNETDDSVNTKAGAITTTSSTTTTTTDLSSSSSSSSSSPVSSSPGHLEAANLALVGQSEPTPLMSAVDVDGGQLVAHEDSPLDCTVRRYTFKQVNTDSFGNKCSGLVTAAMCYGGCDTGEYSDYVFPYKKSIHKVCMHGTRIKRRVLLEDCSSTDVDETLREYHYVDALSCVCQRCHSADATCLGSLTRPYVPTVANGSTDSSALVY